MRAYSQDLRERVLRAVDEGKPREQIIELFHVSRAAIKRYLKQRREMGHVRPRVLPGRTPKKGTALQVLFLPSYSPDLSPIEEMFSKLKAFLRRVGVRTHEALEEAIG